MLTSDLLRVRVRGKQLEPSYIDPQKPSLIKKTTGLCELFTHAMDNSQTRGELQQSIADYCADKRDHKLLKGLAKLLLDKLEFGIHCTVEPRELRQMAFRIAREVGPLALESGLLDRPTAQVVFDSLASQLNVDAQTLQRSLYADLKDNQQLLPGPIPSAEDLLHRYNLGLIQACLLRATGMRLAVKESRPERLRQLFRWIKFHQLIHRCELTETELIIHLDGPTSLFKQSSKYGLQLASLMPAIPLLSCPWTLEAEVLWTKANHRKRLVVDHTMGLVSTRRDTGSYLTKTHQHFDTRWDAKPRAWNRSTEVQPLTLGPHGVVLPDYAFEHQGRTIYLEIIGFWRKETLQRRLDLLARYPEHQLVLAVSKRLLADKSALGDLAEQVLVYSEVLSPAKVIRALDQRLLQLGQAE